MDELGLNFDEMPTDTGLALDYLAKKQHEFRSLTHIPGDTIIKYDNYNNKIHCIEFADYNNFNAQEVEQDFKNIKSKFRKLARLIESKAELFSQLEALIRKIPKDDVKNCDVKLIVQNLLHWSAFPRLYYPAYNHTARDKELVMTDDTPLALLGYIVQKLNGEDVVRIHGSVNTAAVCYLFTELCHEAGLPVNLLFLVQPAPNDFVLKSDRIQMDTVEGLKRGCLGVITACSDVDSAVDALLASTTKYPWKLRRILIQESIYESIKKVFDWKCKLKNTEDTLELRLKQLCTKSYCYEDKVLLFDCADTSVSDQIPNSIQIEAYRTNKELLLLINKYKNSFLSLWGCDVAEVDEIAFSVDTSVVWVNGFGTFDEPARASQGFYSIIDNVHSDYVRNITKCANVDKLLKIRDVWMKKNIDDRLEIVAFAIMDGIMVEVDVPKKLQDDLDLLELATNKFDIQGNKSYIGIDKSKEIIVIDNELNLDCCLFELMSPIVHGRAIFIERTYFDENRHVWEALMKNGAPVIVTDVINEGDYLTACNRDHRHTRVVYKNFGTIFAN